MEKDDISWKLIDKYFVDNPNNLVSHHLESYNEFFRNGIKLGHRFAAIAHNV